MVDDRQETIPPNISHYHVMNKLGSGEIFSFEWSPDGKQLLVGRGNSIQDIVMLTDIQ